MRRYFDLHVHTRYSQDVADKTGTGVSSLVKQAKAVGLSGVAFTDHLDLDRWYAGTQPLDNDGILADVKAEQEKNEGFEVLHGVEVGQQMYYQGLCADLFRKYNYDVVVGSVHILEARPDKIISQLPFGDYTDEQARALFEQYMRELYYTAKYGDIDVLAHLTYPRRYLGRHGKGHVADIDKDLDFYDEIFRVLRDRGVALEVNTSGLRQGDGETFPNTVLLRRYLELGGELLTVGSDAHARADVGADVKAATDLVASLGGKYTCYFKARKPVFVKL